MANFDPDKEMFDQVKESMKMLIETLTQWQQKEDKIHSLAETNAKQSGANPEDMDAHVYKHKKILKRAIADSNKQNSEQAPKTGVPTAQDMPGGPTSKVPPGPQGGPGNIKSPVLPMAGHAQNTGANGWEGLNKPSPYPAQAQTQIGAPTQSVGPVTPAQHPMPGMPTPPVPGGFSNPNTMKRSF